MTRKVVAAALGVLFACLGAGTTFSCNRQTGDTTMVLVHKDQNGKELKVRPGDIIQVELPSSGSAGYSWHIDTASSDYWVLLSEETKEIAAGGKTGAPVTGRWRFRVVKEGCFELRMDCYRQWEGKEKAVDHFVITLYNEG